MSTLKEGLRNTDYASVKFSSTNITEAITRPSFYVEISNNKTDKFNANNKERTVTVKIYYFGSNANKDNEIELLDIQDILENAFLEDLKVKDTFYIPITSLDIETYSNDYLIATLENLYTIEEIPNTDTEPYMDTLDLNLTDNN